ncbi:MAG TPA: hypothetical protein VFV34_23160 [Blastocatellia bacterium]|nr:hypothetical protein [Blastocatellia bacterium]
MATTVRCFTGKNMNLLRRISAAVGLMALVANCGKEAPVGSIPAAPASSYDVAAPRKEIIAQNVLAVQLAPRHAFEAKTTFATTESIPASLFLSDSSPVEKRRITAFLVRDESVVEEQSVSIAAVDERHDFDFRFDRTPRPSGAYEIRFVEIARSSAKPVLLARLFLDIE